MDYRLLGSTFIAVFVAELGDKTQLATLGLAAGGQSRWVVFLGSSLALIACSALAVVLGEGITRVISPVWLRRASGVLFIVLGVLALVRSGAPPAATTSNGISN
jgi:Ca2+/H+ antiporter, TMEM165/GDT1 family